MSGSLELIVGQDIKIRAKIKPTDIGGAGVQSSEWSVPGTVAQEWEADNDSAELDELEAGERKQPGNGSDPGPEHPVQFYWYKGTDAGQDHEVKCEFTLDKGGPLKGVVKYEVVTPEITAKAKCLPEWHLDIIDQKAQYSGGPPAVAGFASSVTVNYGDANSGQLQWVQTVKDATGHKTSNDENVPPQHRNKWAVFEKVEPTRLDTQYPAMLLSEGVTFGFFEDSPDLPYGNAIGNKSFDAIGTHLRFVTFVMYKPITENAHWVPTIHEPISN